MPKVAVDSTPRREDITGPPRPREEITLELEDADTLDTLPEERRMATGTECKLPRRLRPASERRL